MDGIRVVCIVGPTAAGKTAAALELARAVPSLVVNCDSRQVYRDFPVITAQPTPEQVAVCPHRLYGFLDTGQAMSAAAFARLAGEAVAEAGSKGLLPVLVGGTGLYFKTLLEGMAPIPDIPPQVRSRVLDRIGREGPQALHAELARLDPDYAAVIHPNDTQRNARAAEVYLATGRTMTWWHSKRRERPVYECLKIGVGLDLEDLTPLLGERIAAMLSAGALDEVRRAWDRCPDRGAPAWSGIGCAELLAHHLGELDLAEAGRLWLKNTRAYAKRQLTWFRPDREIRWFSPGLEARVVKSVLNWLGGPGPGRTTRRRSTSVGPG
ncbi:MAG: tRNA (adenosine(37)-N6)-dimethylallyltransferase MiaA [Desulfovibrionaceae bacterium]|nr:tRNA (adenosine(37)-N6)-dimethylallyltransferase MiaA [Desulfovibrionaceae bacterium]